MFARASSPIASVASTKKGKSLRLRNRRTIRILDTFADNVLRSIAYLVQVYQTAMDQYAVSVIASWREWPLARRIAAMQFSPATMEAGEAAIAFYNLLKTEIFGYYTNTKGWDEEMASRKAATEAQACICVTLRNAWGCEPIMAYIWQKRYSQVSRHGHFSDGILWGEATYELTLRMLKRIQDDTEYTAESDPAAAIMNDQFVISVGQNPDVPVVQAFLGRLGHTVRAKARCWYELDSNAQRITVDGKDHPVINPFTGKPVISGVDLVAGTEVHATIVGRELNRFLATVTGRPAVQGMLAPWIKKDRQLSTRTQVLVLDSIPGSGVGIAA